MKGYLACALLFFGSVAACFAGDATVEFEGRYWVTDMTGKVKVTSNGVGSAVDFKDDLGMTNRNFPEGRFTWYTGDNSRIRLAYTELHYSGDSILGRPIQFKGTTYSASTPVSSDLTLDYLRLGWIWQFINLGSDTFRLGTIIEVKGFSAKTSLKAPTLGLSDSERIAAPLPTVGLALDIKAHRMLAFFAEVSGVSAGRYGSLIDGEAGVKFMPVKNFGLVGGYRVFNVNGKDDPDYVRMNVQGPFIGATLRF